ncbi:MAG: penicillin-binding transpeptidase domain-containing protein [bacterium]
MNKIIRKIKNQKRRSKNIFIEPDEIFLDSKNLPDFDTQQFEGQISKPISRNSMFGIGILFCVLVLFFGVRLWNLQIQNGEEYKKMSENNSLSIEPIFAARGNIYDTNGVVLVWNNTATDDTPWGQRMYTTLPGFSQILGYVGYPARDSSGNYYQKELFGRDGVEKKYNSNLSGINGSDIVEKDIAGKKQKGSIVNEPIAGKNVTLTIDSRLQTQLYQILSNYAGLANFRSGSAVMMDVRNGDIVAMTNFPEYNSNIMSSGSDKKIITGYLTDSNTPLLNRAISGLFTPGSVVKPYLGLEALKEGVVTPDTQICSCGSITVPNPYDPAHPGVYKDYNPNNGWVDIRHAIAVSSNIFFMEVAGGYKSQKGIGITNLDIALERFGLTQKTGIDLYGEKSGIIPSPEWKAQKFNGEPWRVGDTYNTAIGQYGVQVTPLEMARAVAAISTRGVMVTPHVFKNDSMNTDDIGFASSTTKSMNDLVTPTQKITDISDDQYTVIQEGMRLGATVGTGKMFATLPFTMASKTGTAQVGVGGSYINSWLNVYFPYENPHYVVVVMLEHGTQNTGSATRIAHDFLDWVHLIAPEYTN